MNTKLEVLRMANEDVIATSVCGVGQLDQKPTETYKFYFYLNNTSYGDATLVCGSDNDYQGYTEMGYYHCDANGNIIEKCNHGTKENVVLAAHGITYPPQ